MCVVTVFGGMMKRRARLGISDGLLTACPSSPNCVSSDAHDESQRVEPLELAVSPPQAWLAVEQAVEALPRTTVVTRTSDYLHAECRSAVFGFVDDLELHLRTARSIIALRSASRLGYSDLGVNRQRVESLREQLISQGVVRRNA